ncbi:MAG TPA: amidohydrolase family protein [Gaiellaceae bacterium]
MIVDAHQHFWDPARAQYPWMTDELNRRYGPEHIDPILREYGVAGTIIVQARHSLDETRELLAIAQTTPFVLGVVGWLDLTGDVDRQLGELDSPLVGVRHQVHDELDAKWLLRVDVQRGLAAVGAAGMAYDLLVRTRELPAAVETVRRHPEVKFVLDHVAKRPPDDGAWSEGVTALAAFPNVACKVSGLLSEHDPAGTARLALDWFGADRCMFGSDWPVNSDYGAALAIAGDDPDVLARTAVRTYGLEIG